MQRPDELQPFEAPTLSAEERDPQGTERTLEAPRATSSPLQPSALLTVDPAHYRLGGEIARGGMGRVRRAVDLRVGRVVAVKELLDEAPALQARFEREARITGQLEHPSIVPVYEIGRWPSGRPFFSMKLVVGRPLDQVVGEARDADARLALISRLVPAVEAIAYAHERNVMHRDLKPANVLLGEFGETMVIDWGLARGIGEPDEPLPAPPRAALTAVVAAREGAGLTAVGAVMGTPGYMPPEQVRGEPLDARADVYALGALLYFALSGHAPHEGATVKDLLTQVLTRAPVPLAQRAPEAPADLVGIVEKAMARERSDRYPDARGLARDLAAFSTGRLVAAYRYSSWDLVKRFVRRNRALSSAIAALIVVILGGALAVLNAYRASELARASAVASEQRALLEERAIHQQLAEVYARDAVSHLEQGDHLGAEVLAAASLVELPANPRGPHHPRDGDDGLSAEQRAQALAAPAATWAAARALRFATRGRTLKAHQDWVYDVLASPDGKWLVTSGADRQVYIWDRASGVRRSSLDGHQHTVFQAALSADGHQLATSCYDGRVRLWSFPEGKLLREIRHPSDRVYGICYSSEGKVLAVGLGGVLAAFDADSGAQLASAEVTKQVPFRLDCAREQPLAVLATGGPEAVLIDTHTLRVSQRLPHPDTQASACALSSDGRQVVTADKQGALRRFDLATGKLTKETRVGGSFNALAASPDGRFLAAGAEDVMVVEAESLRPVARLLGHRSSVRSLTFTPESDRIYSGSRDTDVVEWQIPGRRSTMTLLSGGTARIDSIRISPDGRYLVSGDDAAAVRLWELESGRLFATYLDHTAPVRGLQFIDDRHFASSGMDRALYIHDIDSPDVVQHVSLPHFGDEIAYAAESHRMAVGGGDGGIVFIDADLHTSHVVPNVHSDRTWWVGFNRDGSKLASASFSGEIAVVDAATRSVVRRWTGHSDRIIAGAWRPGGEQLVTADLAGWVRGFDPASGERLWQWQVLGGERVSGLAWSPDGRWLLLTTQAGMRLYQAEGSLALRLDLGAGTTAPTWTADNRMIFATEGQIYVLPVDTESWKGDPRALLSQAEEAAGMTLAALLHIGNRPH